MSYEVWGEPGEAPECPSCEENLGTVDELAMLVKRLVRALNKATPGNDLAIKAMDYLARNTTADSSPLRDDPESSPILPQQGGGTDAIMELVTQYMESCVAEDSHELVLWNRVREAVADAIAAVLPQVAEAKPDGDLVLIERGYLGAACYALRHPNLPNSGVLEKLRAAVRQHVPASLGAPRLSAVQIDSIRNTVMIQLGKENAGVIGGPDVEDMLFPKRFAEAIMTALGSPVPACGICGDTGKWHAGYTGLFGGSVPVYETCKCAVKGNMYIGLANGDEWAQDAAAKFILGEAKAVAPEYLKLRFFRDLNDTQRMAVFEVFGLSPDAFDEVTNHSIQSRLFDKLIAAPVAQALPVGIEKPKRLPKLPKELAEFYPSMSAQSHEMAVKEYAKAAISGETMFTHDSVYCTACGGHGMISTGIAGSSTQCDNCDGTGLQGEKA